MGDGASYMSMHIRCQGNQTLDSCCDAMTTPRAFTFMLLMAWLTPEFASAQHTPDASPPPPEEIALVTPDEVSGARRAVSVGAAFVPGLLLHGSGHLALGERRTGLGLLGAEALGLTMLIGGIGGLAVTGAADEFVPPLYWTAMAGAGLFFFSWGADLYGTLGLYQRESQASSSPAFWRISQGYQHVINPALPTTSLSKTQVELFWRRLSVHGMGYVDVRGAQDQRFELRARYRIAGQQSGPDASHVMLGTGFVRHRYSFARTTEALGELFAQGRYDLMRAAPTLQGLFLEGSAGVALGQYRHDEFGAQFEDLLLGTVGLGVYLGSQEMRRGELVVFYDHRHDGYVAGTKVEGLGSGAIGSANVRLRQRIGPRFGLDIGYGAGSAHVFDASITIRQKQ